MRKFLIPLIPILFGAASLRAEVIISEFMANNTESLADENGDYEDWIEIYNSGIASVNLGGWSLTDNGLNPNKWTFPALTLPANQHVIVWASNKNRAVAGSPLHTNFKLDGDGEYLALFKPDATPSGPVFNPFPPQVPDVSFGGAAATTTTQVIQQGTAGKVKVPTDGSLGTSWTSDLFDDATWTAAINGIGFETGTNEFGTGILGDMLADGPTGYYRMEEVGLNGIQAVNIGSTGTPGSYLSGTTMNVATLQSPAFPGFAADNLGARFNGTSHKIDVPHNAGHNTTTFSFSFWMKWNGGNAGTHKAPLTSRISTPSSGYICYVLPTTQQLSFWTGISGSWDTLDAPNNVSGIITANTWHHVAATFDNATKDKRLYLNGSLVASKTAGGTFAPNTTFPLRIGAGSTEGAGSFWFPGDIDEVAVFNRVLTPTEVTAQFSGATTGTLGTEYVSSVTGQSPAGYWRLADSATTNVLTSANLGSAGPAANATANGSVVGGGAGPVPPTEAGMPADNKSTKLSGGYYEVPFHPDLNPSIFTVECWARPTGGAGTFRSPISGRNDQNSTTYGYIFYASNANNWQFWTGSGGTGVWDPIVGPAVTLNQWAHLVGTFDGTTKRFYVNGTQVGVGALSTFNPNTIRPLRIGAGQNETTPNFFFPGDVDELAIYPRALTAGEISGRYQYGKNNTPLPPLNDFGALIATDLEAQMLNQNATAYFRLPFNLSDASAIDTLTLRMKYDDGFQAYLNGTVISSGNAPETLTWNSQASQRSSNADAVTNEIFNLNSALPLLKTGTNVLSIHGLNLDAANVDFLQGVELETKDVGSYTGSYVYLNSATPGSINVGGSSNPGPSLTLESHAPLAPTPTDNLLITVKAAAVLAPVATVELKWRTNYTAEQTIAMTDDGVVPDAAANDGTYSAVIPNSNYAAGNMVRWYFSATDTSSNNNRWPKYLDPLNSPQYFGTMIADTSFTTALPVWAWFTQNTAAAATRGGTRGSVFVGGELYDNVFVRLRGGATSSGSKKFDFNTGAHAKINEVVGRVEEANINGTALSSGISGDSADATLIRPALSFEVYRTSGHPALQAFPVMIRVNGALDTATGRSGIGYYVEQLDERHLRRVNLDDDGALYKMDQRSNLNPVFYDTITGVEKKTRLTENFSDLQGLINGIRNAADGYNYATAGTNPAAPINPPAFLASRKTYLFDNCNLANMVNYLACRAIIGDSDDTRKNFYMYRDSLDTREWHILPWDKDGTFGISLDDTFYNHPFKGDYARRKSPGNSANNQWSYLWEALYNEPASRDMYLRRLRSLMDSILQPSPGGYLEGRADAWWAAVAPHKPSATPAAIKTWLATRRNELFTTYSAANSLGTGLQIPAAQDANVVVNFGSYDALPASGNQEEEFIQISNPNAVAVDISGWKLKGVVDHTFESGTVILPGASLYAAGRAFAFRNRATAPTGGQDLFVQGNVDGSLSARGETVTLVDPMTPATPLDDRIVATLTTTPTPTAAQTQLRITELNYAPAAGGTFPEGEYEFIELRNIGTASLNLGGCTFTNGITYTFRAVTLSPGAYLVLVRNLDAFAERYGNSIPVVGPYFGSLDNSGERIRIVDPVGEEVLDFSYLPTWHPTTDELGGTLVIKDDTAAYDTWELEASWGLGADCHGSPGSTDPSTPTLEKPDAIVIQPIAGGHKITLKAIPGRTYLLESSTDLENWSPLGEMIPNVGGMATFDDLSGEIRHFYKVRCP
jgi:hypothetical protein